MLTFISYVVCAFFGAICGSGSATSAMMCRVAYPEMKRHNYSGELSTGCIATGSMLATLIPPSAILMNYGLIVNESIGKLFMGGIFTGIVLMLLFIFSLGLPFMAIAYFLRGISMTQMLVTSILLFVQLIGLTQLALLAGATGKRWITGVFVLVFLQCGVPFLSLIFMVNSFSSAFGS